MPAGGHAPGSLTPRRKPRSQRRKVNVANVVARSVVRTAHTVARPQPRSQNRPPNQVIHKRQRKTGGDTQRNRRQTRQANRTARSVATTAWQTDTRAAIADTAAASVARTARRTAKGQRPQRRTLYTPITAKARRETARRYPAPHDVISHRTVVRAKAREQLRRDLADPLLYKRDPMGPFSPLAKRKEAARIARLPKKGALTPFLHRLTHPDAATLRGMGYASAAAASPAGLPGATIQVNPSPKEAEQIGRFGFNAVKDAIDIPANAPGAIYNVSAAGFEALHGDTKRAKQLYKGLKDHDPLFLAAQGRFKEAAHEIGERPVSFALELSGAKATIGTGIGKAQRAAGASREAQAAVLEGTKVRIRRPYSKDAETRRRQIAKDRRRTKKAQEYEREAQQAEASGAHEQAVELRHKAREASPVHVKDSEIRRRVDERNDANEQVRRTFRGRAIQKAAKHKVPERKGGHLVSLVAQGVVHADRADIAAYLRELDVQYQSGALTQAQKVANRATYGQITKALASKQLDLPRIKQAAEGFARDQERAESALIDSGLMDARQAEKARLIPYAVRRMGASHNGDRIVGPNGQFLSAAAIKGHMRQHGVDPDTIAYLSQAPNARGAKNFYLNTLQRNTLASRARTGEATRHGTFDTHPDTLIEQASRVANLHAADHGYKGLVDEFAIRHPDSGDVQTFATKRGADLFIRDQHAHGARKLRAIRVNPFLGTKKDLESLLEHVNEGTETPTGLLKVMEDAIRGEDGAGPWVLIHEATANRIQEHLGLQNPMVGLKGLQKVNQAFRNTVLPTSTKWITGNIVEATFRTALTRAGPLSYLTGRRTLAELDRLAESGAIPEALAQEARARATGGGHFSMAERTSVHRDAAQFEHSVLRPAARAFGAFARAPGPKHLGLMWHAYTHFVFKTNTLLEKQFQTALAGKYIREMLPTKGELSTSQKAVEQAARGLTNTNEQVAMARFVDRAYGKYSKFNPTERAAVAYYTPFIAWSLNAVKFVGSVLPKDHPIFTGLLVASHNASQEWLNDHGLNLFIENAAPGWLQGSIPTGNGGKVRAGRYLPFGFFSDPAQSIAGTVMPQYMGAIFALNGLDWKGDPLTGFHGGEPTQGKKFGAALEQFFGGTVPILGQVKNFGEKEGPTGQKLNRQFNPFYPVQPTKTEGSSGGGWGTGGGSSSGGWGG